MTQTQLPAHLANYQTPDIGGVLSANLGSSMPPHVSIGNNRFTLIDASNNEIPVPTFDPQIGPYLDAAIIDVNPVMSRIYFGGQYDPASEGVRPDCFSDNGVGPSVSASSPQAPTCAACPRSEWTKVNANGKKVPWCSQKQKVALLIPGFPTLFLLAVPPNSHGPLREYVQHCKGNNTNIADLVTRMWFVSQGTLGFKPVQYIDVAAAEMRQAAYTEKKTDSLVGRNDVARPAGMIAAPVQPIQPVQLAPQQVGNFGVAPIQQVALQPQQGKGAPQGQWPTQPIQQNSTPNTQWSAMQTSLHANTPASSTANTGAWPATNAQTPQGQGFQAGNPGVFPAAPEQPTQRRKRRTQAEIAADNARPAPAGASNPPQAPFPHPGQQTAPTTPQAGQLEFGIGQGQPAGANPEITAMLDGFFSGDSK